MKTIVRNPRDFPKGVPILTVKDTHYYEGDVLPKGAMTNKQLAEHKARGFLEEQADGG